jgi:Mlc titration factor MtfA (ptsG expression regulator)
MNNAAEVLKKFTKLLSAAETAEFYAVLAEMIGTIATELDDRHSKEFADFKPGR